MATGSRVHSRKGGTAHRSEDAETNVVTATVPAGAKLDKSGLYDQQQVKRLLDDQLVAVRIQLQRSKPSSYSKFRDYSDCFSLLIADIPPSPLLNSRCTDPRRYRVH
jgi:hypothetical protein